MVLVYGSDFSSSFKVFQRKCSNPVEGVGFVNVFECDFKIVCNSNAWLTQGIIRKVNITFDPSFFVNSTKHDNIHNVVIPNHFPEVAKTWHSWSLGSDKLALLTRIRMLKRLKTELEDFFLQQCGQHSHNFLIFGIGSFSIRLRDGLLYARLKKLVCESLTWNDIAVSVHFEGYRVILGECFVVLIGVAHLSEDLEFISRESETLPAHQIIVAHWFDYFLNHFLVSED